MAYSDFNLAKALSAFQLSIQENIFAQPISITPSQQILDTLRDNLSLAIAIGTEKARSEMLITPILIEVRKQLDCQVSLFSGREFTVDPDAGLNGVCDYLISRSPEQLVIQAPVAVIVEAKKGDLSLGYGQCVAEMVAAQRWNQQAGNLQSVIYGAVSSGSLWQFIKLAENVVTVDLTEYPVPPVDQILGLFVNLLTDNDGVIT
jgi:hypothetical protein